MPLLTVINEMIRTKIREILHDNYAWITLIICAENEFIRYRTGRVHSLSTNNSNELCAELAAFKSIVGENLNSPEKHI